jgi:hypothetical protein
MSEKMRVTGHACGNLQIEVKNVGKQTRAHGKFELTLQAPGKNSSIEVGGKCGHSRQCVHILSGNDEDGCGSNQLDVAEVVCAVKIVVDENRAAEGPQSGRNLVLRP